MREESILQILNRLGVPIEAFCRLCNITRDDLFAIDEGVALPSVQIEAITKLIRNTGRKKLVPIIKLLKSDTQSISWKVIPDFPDYEASNLGHIRRKYSSGRGAVRTLKRMPTKEGYYKVSLYNSSGRQPTLVHRAVCLAFHGHPPPEKPHACHKNGISTDCRSENLYWGSPKENALDTERHRKETIKNSVHIPYTLLKVPEIRALYKEGKLSKNKALELVKKKSPRTR